MGAKKKFAVLSSFADDIILNNDTMTLEKREGGPALFIKKTLDDLGEEYDIARSKKGIVEILIEGGVEKGRIVNPGKVYHPRINANTVLVSTLLDEVNLERITGEYDHIYVDVQGFVRDPTQFGCKKDWNIKRFKKIKMLKTTDYEMKHIPPALLEQVKQNGILIVTRGGGDVTVYDHGKEHTFKVDELHVGDTIGAGDTLFAAFSSKYAETGDVNKAMEFGLEHTKKFLLETKKNGAKK